jgi:hypothetical protein
MLENKSQTMNELFWSKQVIPKSTPLVEGEEVEGKTAPEEEFQETEPLAVILVNSMFHLLFLPGMRK